MTQLIDQYANVAKTRKKLRQVVLRDHVQEHSKDMRTGTATGSIEERGRALAEAHMLSVHVTRAIEDGMLSAPAEGTSDLNVEINVDNPAVE